MLKWITGLVAGLVLATSSAAMETAGDWHGELNIQPGVSLPLVLHIAGSEPDWQVSLDSPNQNVMTQAPDNIEMFYFSGISVAILDVEQREKLFDLINTLRSSGCRIVFDPNYRPRLWRDQQEAQEWMDKSYQVADIAFPGGDDHLALYGHTNADDVLAHLAPFGIGEVVMKNGAVGVHIVNNEGQFIVPVQTVTNVVDTTAAGDAFNGGYLAARLSGKNVTESASFGAMVAGTVIQHPGAIIPADTLRKAVTPL